MLAFGAVGCHRQAQPAVTAAVVQTVTVAPTEVPDELVASGVVEAVDKVQLAFQVPGRVQSIAVEDGATVAAGDLIATLDDADLRNEVAIADAKRNEIRSRHERLARLHDLGSLTATDFEKSAAALAQADASAELAHRRLDYAQLRAPFAGRVMRGGVAVGAVVAPSIPVCSVVAVAPVWADLSIPEVDAPRLRPGQKAVVTLAAADANSVESVIETVLPVADSITRSFAAKIRLQNEDGRFRPGNIVTGRIALGATHRVILIPPKLVQRYADGALYVWIIDPARNVATRRIIMVGRPHGTGVEVVSGLQPGERIVEGGAIPLFDGMPVHLAKP